MNNTYFLLLTIEEKTGGLFDFDGTLPFVAIEFLISMVILDKLLYKPILNIVSKRKNAFKSLRRRYEDRLLKVDVFKEKLNQLITSLNEEQKNTLVTFSSKIDENLNEQISIFEKIRMEMIIKLEQEITQIIDINNPETRNLKEFLMASTLANLVPNNNQ
uniref:ATP synthase CF0 B' subunit n=1 Tax=Haramonas pauciplastida TaxID=478668 RepID=UPI002114E3CE|nr:ATP synthase CF0 B' subunit [Haramonas pauciplastida]UTE94999.1 ATP synthase CF0 B' subunit [Haramonas pauciplastida]